MPGRSARQGIQQAGGRGQAGSLRSIQHRSDGGNGPEIAARLDAVPGQRSRGFHIMKRIVGLAARGARLPAGGGVYLPNPVAAEPGFVDGLFEGVLVRRIHLQHPPPGRDPGRLEQMTHIAAELLPRDLRAALDEVRDAFEFGVAQAAQGFLDPFRLDPGQRRKGFLLVLALDGPGHPGGRQGQHQPGRHQEDRFGSPPPPSDFRGFAPAPLPPAVAGAGQAKQQGGAQEGPDGRSGQLVSPGLFLEIDAHDGQQFAGARIGQGDIGAHPGAPAVAGRAFGGGHPGAKYIPQDGRGLFIGGAGTGRRERALHPRVHLEEDGVVGDPRQIDGIQVGEEIHHGLELVQQLPVIRLGFVGRSACQPVQPVQGDGLRHQPGLVEQVFPDQPVLPPHGPAGEQRAAGQNARQ